MELGFAVIDLIPRAASLMMIMMAGREGDWCRICEGRYCVRFDFTMPDSCNLIIFDGIWDHR